MPSNKSGSGLFQDDCDRPACDDIKDALPKSMAEVEALRRKLAKQQEKVECPPRSAELGRASWKLLHSMAAWYPDKPTMEQKHKITNFFTALAEFYPCTWCADDFQANIKKTPIQAESREELCLWLCDQHNRVNQKLGKPTFQCTMKNLDERWRKSSNPKCSGGH